MKDVLGNDLKVGDKVLSVTRWGDLKVATITNINSYSYSNTYFTANVKYESNRVCRNKHSSQLVKI